MESRGGQISSRTLVELQRAAGNNATAGALARGKADSAAVVVQRNIGLEIEFTNGNTAKGMALAPTGSAEWEKRYPVKSFDTWDLTLDDTPGVGEYDAEGTEWDEEFAPKEPLGKGPFRKYNLEFILHGGGATGRHGFLDGDIEGLLKAVEAIKEFCTWPQYPKNIQTISAGAKSTLHVHFPTQVPDSANIQLTAGTSLAGLYRLFEDHHRLATQHGAGSLNMRGSLQEASKGGRNQIDPLVFGDDHQVNLAAAHVSAEEVAAVFRSGGQVAPGFRRALHAVAAMLTLVKTFLLNQEKARSSKGNIKEATPMLWKTPLHLFLESADISDYEETIRGSWPALLDVTFPGWQSEEIEHPPGNKIGVWEWLTQLPDRDLLTEADAEYDKSFGGLGALEGGKEPSAGHPILEFRSVPNTLHDLEKNLLSSIELLRRINISSSGQ